MKVVTGKCVRMQKPKRHFLSACLPNACVKKGSIVILLQFALFLIIGKMKIEPLIKICMNKTKSIPMYSWFFAVTASAVASLNASLVH